MVGSSQSIELYLVRICQSSLTRFVTFDGCLSESLYTPRPRLGQGVKRLGRSGRRRRVSTCSDTATSTSDNRSQIAGSAIRTKGMFRSSALQLNDLAGAGACQDISPSQRSLVDVDGIGGGEGSVLHQFPQTHSSLPCLGGPVTCL